MAVAIRVWDLPPAFGKCAQLTRRSVQVPGYLKSQDALRKAGIDEVLVYCVNDGAVMQAWAADQKVKGSCITFLADTRCELTEALGMVMDHPGPMDALGNLRCKRFVMVLDDGVIKHLAVSEADGDPAGDNEPDGPVTKLTRVEAVLAAIAAAKM